ncbi:nucleotidyltransferase domain-containing protein [Thermoflavimicrobium dichotomicum]|uniref:Uncharacterized protein n=1 Tax=Thermoflavimicrobium dichotomicum TaxID=46223 RepID=A0A1I3VJE9_9BACL|nr:hypothetical protein [Thermoflavimicrobium dichotomicum]SFJ95488.1 hypothetical protein SAMN05421852_1582 [Thermoflavimicrobium dichotomicum]
MGSKEYLDVLFEIHRRMENANILWALTGSLGMALQGVPVEVHDIDIQTNRSGAYRLEELFSAYVARRVAFSSTDRIRSHFGALNIRGIQVEIMGDIEKRLPDGTWEEPVDLRTVRHFIEVEGRRIPVLSLDYEYEAYLKLGRAEKADLIRKYCG